MIAAPAWALRGAGESARWRALGTGVSVVVTDPVCLMVARAVVESELAEIDLAASRFRADSELTRVNRAGGRWVSVSALFLDVLCAALRGARLTDGDVDPTIGRALSLIGHDRDFGEFASGPAPPGVVVVETSGWRSVVVDWDGGRVRVPRGVQLDFGAAAKALAADRAAQSVAKAVDAGVLVNLGGDIAVAGRPPAAGWPLRVTDDHAASFDAPGQTVSITSGGVATSTTTVRRWTGAKGPVHHIVDPATGHPAAEVWRTVSVAAGSCVDANTASTAAIVRGDGAPEWLEATGLPARLVTPEGRVLRVGGWPAEALS